MRKEIPKDAYAMIIGAMKCGTTSLFSYLQDHPEICPARIKEPEFFSENQVHGLKVHNYNDLWDFDNSVHRYALEASTGYSKFPVEPNVAKKIYDYGITPKFIYIIRNPFERIASHYNYMQKKDSWLLNIDDTHLISTSNYFLQLEQYRNLFPIKNFLILDFDELKDNPVQILRRIYLFLEISNNYYPESFDIKNQTQLESSLERNLKKSKFKTFFNYIPRPVKQFGKNLLIGNTPPPDKRILTKAEKNYIYNRLKDSMADLHNSYGFDVSKWGFNNK